jgi:uncharacterized membrane-anchored protein YitT (DUF2179 family)
MRKLLFCTAGAMCLATAIVVFLSPNHIAAGGPPGIAIILFHSFGIDKGLTLLLLNGALMTLGLRTLGAAHLARTFYAIAATAACTYALSRLMQRPAVTAEPLLNALYGGVLAGVGIGLVFRGEASSGGWSLLARLLSRRSGIGVGQCIFLLDTVVVIASAVAFRDIESALWAGIGIYMTGFVVDLVLTGRSGTKIVQISTRQSDKLATELAVRLKQAGGMVHCNTMTDRSGRDVMFVVVETGQISLLNEVVRRDDPQAYVVVMDAVEFYAGGMTSPKG